MLTKGETVTVMGLTGTVLHTRKGGAEGTVVTTSGKFFHVRLEGTSLLLRRR